MVLVSHSNPIRMVICNAVHDMVGIRFYELRATPEEVLAKFCQAQLHK